MTKPTFEDVWTKATGIRDPFPYQRRLATGDWPDVLDVPTGMGKTAAIGLAWIYKRMTGAPDTPRRLVYCLPMRVLAEQTAEAFAGWLSRLGRLGEPGEGKVSVSVLMGGEPAVREASWARHPEEDAVLIGTQDMLLSRALMRGYGMSRYQWPIHFGLLHNDAVWVFDEVQLMGPGLSTSTQLEAFRRAFRSGRPCRSLWISATLNEEWLGSVDFRAHTAELKRLGIEEDDRQKARERLDATKRLHRADVVLDAETAKAKAYLDALADAVRDGHVDGQQTLVVVNRVERAQELAARLHADDDVPVLLVHARFRAAERSTINARLREKPGNAGRIVVATQAVEAGVDITSRVLFTELAPWSSLVQRFGRCNRYGEHREGTDIYWIDITDDADQAAPYDAGALSAARATVEVLDGAGPARLPPVPAEQAATHVLRRKDLIELFDTDPDLSGFDIDVAPYIRDQGTPQVQVFWRAFEDAPPDEEPGAHRQELCPASLGQVQAYLKKPVRKRPRLSWVWDSLEDRWVRRDRNARMLPGSTLLLRAGDGGYDAFLGFLAASTQAVPVLDTATGDAKAPYNDDPDTRSGRFVSLDEHTRDVVRHVEDLTDRLGIDNEAPALQETALWHDVGKAHPAFQAALLDFDEEGTAGNGTIWAKSSGSGRLRYRIETDETIQKRPHFRHELASMLAWISNSPGTADADLIAFLIAAHHGKVRMGLRALPAEPVPPDDTLFARGVHHGDILPAVNIDGLEVPETTLRLDIMRLGRGDMGPSWTERTHRLLQAHGPFRLAWLEAMVRIADGRASAEEEANHA